MDILVTTGWLAAELGAPDLVVLDATSFLPGQGKDAEVEFGRAHIPSARRFDVDLIAAPEGDLPHMVPSPARFARLVAALGAGYPPSAFDFGGRFGGVPAGFGFSLPATIAFASASVSATGTLSAQARRG